VKVNYQSVELFGVSGSGKTHIRNLLKKKLEVKNYEIFDTRELIIKYIGQLTKPNFFDFLILKFFNFLLFFDIKTTLWNYTLNKLSNKLLKNNEKLYKKLKTSYEINIFKKKNKFFNIVNIWLKELIVAFIIFEKVKKKEKIIYFPEEGFLQKVFLLGYKNKLNKNILKKYLNLKLFCNKIILVKNSKKRINLVHKIRKEKKQDWLLNSSEINRMYMIQKFLEKNIKFKFQIINNSKEQNFNKYEL